MARVGPVIMSVVGDAFTASVTVRAINWTGATTAGDTVVLRERSTNNIIFEGRAVGTQTWEGVALNMSCPGGFFLSQISAGKVLVYLAEPE